jgi:hypothetical protein
MANDSTSGSRHTPPSARPSSSPSDGLLAGMFARGESMDGRAEDRPSVPLHHVVSGPPDPPALVLGNALPCAVTGAGFRPLG